MYSFESRKVDVVDVKKLTLVFATEPMEGQHTLVELGMCDKAKFSVLGVADAQLARPGEELAESAAKARTGLAQAAQLSSPPVDILDILEAPNPWAECSRCSGRWTSSRSV